MAGPVGTFGIFFKLRGRSAVNIVIRFEVTLVNLIIPVREIFPDVLALHLCNSSLLLFLLILLLLHLFLSFSLLEHMDTLTTRGFFLLLAFHKLGVGLHVNGNHEGGEGVASDDTSIVHYVLWSDLDVLAIGVTVRSLVLDDAGLG